MDHLLDIAGDVPTESIDPAQVVDGAPVAGSRVLAAISGVEVGVWEISPGVVTDTESDEVFIVLSGAATVTFEDGASIELAPGSVARLREGERTTWAVQETLRKIYIA